MSQHTSRSIRWILLAASLVLGGACIIEAAAGPTPTPQVVVGPGDGDSSTRESDSVPATPETPLELTATWTLTPELTATATIDQVTMTAGQDLSCVTGPHWVLYEWVARIEEGETVTLLARACPEWEEYYFVHKSSGTPASCWAFGGSSAIHGDPSILPIREAPPLPQITLTVQNKTYLRLTNLRMRPKDETVWETNLLAAHEIQGQETYGLTITAGFYDIRIMDYRSGVVYEAYDVPIGAEPSSKTIVLDGRYTVNIHSESTLAFCQVHIESFDHAYNADLTIPGDGRISPGEDVTLEGLGGAYVMQLSACSGSTGSYGIAGAYIGPATRTYTVH
ncbi:MAG: hypothetical protein JW929_04600 [Anaerolineales bacterium]|nr:hypothetical protein [Anaerolineales bacterium]